MTTTKERYDVVLRGLLKVRQDDTRAKISMGNKWVTLRWRYRIGDCGDFKTKTIKVKSDQAFTRVINLIMFEFENWIIK